MVPFCVAYVEQPLTRVNQLLRAAPLPNGSALEYVRTHATPYFLLGWEVSKRRIGINMLWLKA